MLVTRADIVLDLSFASMLFTLIMVLTLCFLCTMAAVFTIDIIRYDASNTAFLILNILGVELCFLAIVILSFYWRYVYNYRRSYGKRQ
ncbi:hypothetical protein CEXT_501481 [Caerostris extrusa]|uniref:Uncharacterized protein n=1 Tax=Caerostris extrusa TaxID=172846 RepID=A0AAV4V1G9_CAEEX|nr:hypothetical protein CEXT_501481 [Caerostris extrusa]